jgi:uncharacterized protein YaaN involved in tellurite resistance
VVLELNTDAPAPVVLVAAEPEPEVTPNKAQSFVEQPDAASIIRIDSQAKGFVTDLVAFNPNSPEFASRLTDIQNLAQTEIVASGEGTNRLLERSIANVRKNGGDASTKVVASLTDLRSTVSELTPNAADLKGARKILGFIPGGKRFSRFLQKYESAQAQLDAIVVALSAGQDELAKDNASLQQEKTKQWAVMGELNKFILFAESVDKELVTQIAALRGAGNVDAAKTLDTDMLYTVRKRHQELLVQLAVAIQGFMGMEMTRKNNVELIKGVDQAKTTTIQALRQSVMIAQALDTQKKVLDQLDAVKATTEQSILSTAAMLQTQTARIHEQATSPAVSIEVIGKAFDSIFATLDQIDTFKTKANATMEANITTLSAQLEKARPQLERAKALEGSTTPAIGA